MPERPLALFDIDKTMFDGLSLFPLIDAQTDEGIIDSSTAEYANIAMGDHREGSLSYEDLVKKLMDIYAAGLLGQPVADVEDSTNRFFTETSGFFNYVAPTIDVLTPTHEVVLVTGSSQFTAGAVARAFGVANSLSTVLETNGDSMSGRVRSYLATRHEKRSAINHLVQAHPHHRSFGFGDSEGDIEMLGVVETPICINPTPGLEETARLNGWAVIRGDEQLMSDNGLVVVRDTLAFTPGD